VFVVQGSRLLMYVLLTESMRVSHVCAMDWLNISFKDRTVGSMTYRLLRPDLSMCIYDDLFHTHIRLIPCLLPLQGIRSATTVLSSTILVLKIFI